MVIVWHVHRQPMEKSFTMKYHPTSERILTNICLKVTYASYAIKLLKYPTHISAIGDAILDTIKALYFFLQRDALEQLPYLIACQLGVFPSELDKKVVRLLSECLIPFTLSSQEWLSVPAVLMLVLQHSSDPSKHHHLQVDSTKRCSPYLFRTFRFLPSVLLSV